MHDGWFRELQDFLLLRYTRPFPAKYLAIRDYWKSYSTYDKCYMFWYLKIRLYRRSFFIGGSYPSVSIMVLNIWVTSPDTHSERRIDPHITVEQLKVTHPCSPTNIPSYNI